MTRPFGILAVALLCTAGMASGQSTQARKFVQRMWLADMAEIELGQIAEQRATSPDVKAFASRIVSDATQSHASLRTLAQRLGVARPAELDRKHKSIASQLLDLNGRDFDRAFMRAMVDEHADVISETRKIAQGRVAAVGTAGGMRAESVVDYAAMEEPLVEQHLEQARAIVRRLGK